MNADTPIRSQFPDFITFALVAKLARIAAGDAVPRLSGEEAMAILQLFASWEDASSAYVALGQLAIDGSSCEATRAELLGHLAELGVAPVVAWRCLEAVQR